MGIFDIFTNLKEETKTCNVFCINCEYRKLTTVEKKLENICCNKNANPKRDLVTGRYSGSLCSEMRCDENKCGTYGRWYAKERYYDTL